MTQPIDTEPTPANVLGQSLDFDASWMSEIQRERLQEFDQSLRTVEEADVAISIAGTLTGVKPGALIEELPRTISLQRFRELGLYYAPVASQAEWLGEVGVISRSSAIADELSELASVRKPDPLRDTRMGELLGFPLTATEYYNRRLSTVGTPWELPVGQGTLHDERIEDYFAQLILSPDHYEEEMETYVRPLQMATRQLMPHAYAIIEQKVSRSDSRLRKLANTVIGK